MRAIASFKQARNIYTCSQRLAVDPNSNNILFFGARSGNGLWKSTDFGKTWAKISSLPNTGTIDDLVPVERKLTQVHDQALSLLIRPIPADTTTTRWVYLSSPSTRPLDPQARRPPVSLSGSLPPVPTTCSSRTMLAPLVRIFPHPRCFSWCLLHFRVRNRWHELLMDTTQGCPVA